MDEFGKIILHVDEVIKAKGISKNKICKETEMKRTPLNRYCKNDVVRIDFETICKLCYILGCDIPDLLEYQRPNDQCASPSPNEN